MVKQRPSNHFPIAETIRDAMARPWKQRVFRNTYARNGQTRQVKGWSVKIQFQGTRKTFSLKARLRNDAAREAREIYRVILTQGWDAAREFYRLRQTPRWRQKIA